MADPWAVFCKARPQQALLCNGVPQILGPHHVPGCEGGIFCPHGGTNLRHTLEDRESRAEDLSLCGWPLGDGFSQGEDPLSPASPHQECTLKVQDGKFKLQDLLVVPMQRVLKYHLLLKVRLSPARHAPVTLRSAGMGWGPRQGGTQADEGACVQCIP